MKNNVDGNNQKPVMRNQNSSAVSRSSNAGNIKARPNPNTNRQPVKGQPAQRQVQRQPQRQPQAQRPVNPANRVPAQKPAAKQVQKPVQRAGQRPVPNQAQRPVQRTAQKPVPNQGQRPAQNSARKPVTTSPKNSVKRPAGPKRRKKPFNFVPLALVAASIILIVSAYIFVKSFLEKEYALINQEATIEAGTVKPELGMFVTGKPAYSKFVSCNLNFDEVNINLPQTVRFTVTMYGKNFPCVLTIVDTIAPTGAGVPQSIYASQPMPDPMTCVTNVQDVTDVTATWYEVPDMSRGGRYNTYVTLTDAAGNQTYVGVPFEVTVDSNAPEIKGYQDLEVYIGDTISYRKNLIITDDHDPNPALDIDTSKVDMKTPGKYDVVYTARDFSGNETSVQVKLSVKNKPEGYIEPEMVYAEARKILAEITEPGMTEEEVALQIVWWCRYNIRFILRTKSSSWTEAAYNAYTKRTGNCYSTVYAVKALLDVAGIENMIIERYPYQTATHYWNYVKLNGQWYHCDSTWRKDYDSYFFMYTTKELLNFWQGGWNGFQFKQKAYPESATESVQKRIDYKNHKFKS